MRWQLAIHNPITNVMLADWSNRIKSCHVRSGAHGWETCEAELDLPFYEAFLYYQQLGALKVRVVWGGYKLFEGRLEDPTQFANIKSGLKIHAFGSWTALNDTTYIALWSDSKVDQWREVLATELANRAPKMYKIDFNNRIFIALTKNALYRNANDIASVTVATPNGSSRTIVGISFAATINLPLNWTFEIRTLNDDFSTPASITTFTGTGASVARAFYLTFTGQNRLEFAVYNGTGGNYTNASEDGVFALEITQMRVVTSTTNAINTTLSAGRAAGTNVTATVVSTTRMFVGQKLVMKSSGNPSEIVTVLSIGSATQFNATFVGSYANGDAVQAHVIYADEVIKDCVSVVNALNSTQLSSDTSAIQSQALDLDQLIIEDQTPTTVINNMLAKSDNQTIPRQWVAMIYDDQRLIVRPKGSGTAWYVDVASLEVVRTLTNLYNSVYAVYNDASNKRKLRTAVSSDAASIAKFDVTRKTSTTVNTGDSIQAGKVRDALLQNQLDPIPRAKITIEHIYDKLGNPYPLFFIRADDTLTLRNLPPILTATYDRIRTLVITHVDYDAMARSVTLELEIPIPDQSILLARALLS